MNNKRYSFNRDISVIVPAAGRGKRMGKNSVPKILIRLKGKPLLGHVIDKFIKIPQVKEIIIAVNPWDRDATEKLTYKYRRIKTPIKLVKGGKERQNSVANALKITDPKSRIILIHDAARPLVKTGDIIKLIKAVRKTGAAILAVPVIDTIKRVSPKGYVKETLKRSELRAVQTPQGFKREILLKAYRKRVETATDDASLVEKIGYPVKIIPGSYENIKITTPIDKIIADYLLCHFN